MKLTKKASLVGSLAVVLLSGTAFGQETAPPSAPAITDYEPVTADQLLNPSDGEWPMYRRTYDGHGHSPLSQITSENVADLEPVWSFSTGVIEGHESPPIVVNGVMFITTPENHVMAIDAVTGEQYWRYTADVAEDTNPSHPTNRGVAVLGDKVYYAARDATLVALDAKTGEEVWTAEVAPTAEAYYMTLAPLIAEGKVMVGVSGGEYGIRGFVAAYDAESGEEAWRTYVVPAPGEPGSETWPEGDAYKTGAGSTWISGNYDPESKLVYWGTGNAGPWMGDQRPGDNLYTTSVLALAVDSGEIEGHFQYHHNDSWDWDEVDPPLLLDFEKDGETVKGLVHPGRNGILWALERTAEGPINFVWGKPYVHEDYIESIDSETGRIEYVADKKPSTGVSTTFCPSLHGGKDWPPAAYNPDSKLVYIPANTNLCSELSGAEVEYEAGQPYMGFDSISFIVREGADYVGSIQAWDISTGEMAWEYKYEKSANWGPILSTGGNLIFAGGSSDRMFRALDATTGKVLWEQKLNSGVIGVPVSYEVDGKQYIAVQAGFGIDAVYNHTVLAEYFGLTPDVPQGGVLWVFALPDEEQTN